MAETSETILEALIVDQEKNTRQNVTNVEKIVHYHSNQHKENQYIVEIVSER